MLQFHINQEREFASTAVIDGGSAMWVIGGLDVDSSQQFTTQVGVKTSVELWSQFSKQSESDPAHSEQYSDIEAK